MLLAVGQNVKRSTTSSWGNHSSTLATSVKARPEGAPLDSARLIRSHFPLNRPSNRSISSPNAAINPSHRWPRIHRTLRINEHLEHHCQFGLFRSSVHPHTGPTSRPADRASPPGVEHRSPAGKCFRRTERADLPHEGHSKYAPGSVRLGQPVLIQQCRHSSPPGRANRHSKRQPFSRSISHQRVEVRPQGRRPSPPSWRSKRHGRRDDVNHHHDLNHRRDFHHRHHRHDCYQCHRCHRNQRVGVWRRQHSERPGLMPEFSIFHLPFSIVQAIRSEIPNRTLSSLHSTSVAKSDARKRPSARSCGESGW